MPNKGSDCAHEGARRCKQSVAKCGPKYLHSRQQKLRGAVQGTCTRGHKEAKVLAQLLT